MYVSVIIGGLFINIIKKEIFYSPQFLLSVLNIYYSLKAIKSRINKKAMSLLAFFSCSIQYAIAIILVIFGIEMVIITIPYLLGYWNMAWQKILN